MIFTTELSALSLVRAFLRGDEVHVVALAGDHVLLVKEVHHPERVNNVARLNFDLNLFVNRQNQLRKVVDVYSSVGIEVCLHTCAIDVVVNVVEVPGPTLTDDLNRDIRIDLDLFDFRLITRSESEETDHQDERNDGVKHFDRHVVSKLNGETRLAATTAVYDGGPNDKPPRDDTHHEQYHPRCYPQADNAAGVVSGFGISREPALQLLLSTAGQDQHRNQSEWDRCPSNSAVRAHL